MRPSRRPGQADPTGRDRIGLRLLGLRVVCGDDRGELPCQQFRVGADDLHEPLGDGQLNTSNHQDHPALLGVDLLGACPFARGHRDLVGLGLLGNRDP